MRVTEEVKAAAVASARDGDVTRTVRIILNHFVDNVYNLIIQFWTDRQRDKQTDRQMDRRTDGRTDGRTDSHPDRLIRSDQTDRQTDRETGRQTDRYH